MKRKYTRLEKELLDTLMGVTFYADHNPHCSKIWNHDPNLPCDCKQGWATIRANILLTKHGMGFAQNEVDKVLPKKDE